MNSFPLRSLIVLALGVSLPLRAQSSVGFRDMVLKNPRALGSKILPLRVFYPSTSLGKDAPIFERQEGYPVIVFLHGVGLLGSSYMELGYTFASRGYIAVHVDTAMSNPDLQALDGIAIHAALVIENNNSRSAFKGLLNMKQSGLAGHSMGGGNTIRVLASNPGYQVGVCFAPWGDKNASYTAKYADKVRVPVGFISGDGDTITPWRTNSLPIYAQLKGYRDIKFHYLLNKAANHANLVAYLYPGATRIDKEVFDRSLAVGIGIFDHYLNVISNGLDASVGVAARSEKRLVALNIEVGSPLYFKTGPQAIGKTSNFHLIAEPGLSGHLLAARIVPTPTPWGLLMLEPASLVIVNVALMQSPRLSTLNFPVPNEKSLRGLKVPFQGFGMDRLARLRFSRAVLLEIAN